MTKIRPIKVVHFTHDMNSTQKKYMGRGKLETDYCILHFNKMIKKCANTTSALLLKINSNSTFF